MHPNPPASVLELEQKGHEPRPGSGVDFSRGGLPGARNSVFNWKVAAYILAVAVTIWITLLVWKWPFTQRSVVAALEHEFGRQVKIGSFRSTLFPPGYSAENLVLVGASSLGGSQATMSVR